MQASPLIVFRAEPYNSARWPRGVRILQAASGTIQDFTLALRGCWREIRADATRDALPQPLRFVPPVWRLNCTRSASGRHGSFLR
jgi:hypothetical protein